MNVTSVSLTYGRKMNLGDFNNAHLELAIGADVQEGDDLNEVMHDLWAMVRQNVKEHALPLLGKGSDPEAAFLGLPSQMDKWQPLGSPPPQAAIAANGHRPELVLQKGNGDDSDDDWLGDIDPDDGLPFGDK